MYNLYKRIVMKKYNLYSALLTFLLVFAACSDDTDPQYNTDSFVKAVTITAPQSGKVYVLEEENADEIFDQFSWEAADYGVAVGQDYRIEIDKEGNNFGSPVVVVQGIAGQSRSLTVKELNRAVVSFHTDYTNPVKVEIRLVSRAKGGEDGNVVLNSFPETKSEPLVCSVTPYKMAGGRTPVYFVGSIFDNNWNHADASMILFANDDEDNFQYTYTGFVPEGSEFKLVQVLGDWGIQWGLGSAPGLLSGNGNNIGGFAKDGFYTLTFDLSGNTYSIAPYTGTSTEYNQISLIGDFNSWSGDLDLVQSSFDKHIWFGDAIKIPSDGELKIRVNHDWTVSFGGSNGLWKEEQGEFAAFDGGDNVPVKAGKYFVKFNDITKHIILIRK